MKPLVSLLALALLFLQSCQNNADQAEMLNRLSDTTSVTGLTGDEAKLVKTAGMQLKVKNVEENIRRISGLARDFGGMVYVQDFQSVEGDRKEFRMSRDSLLVLTTVTPQANITVRVPSPKLEEFLFAVSDLGYFTGSSRLHIDDKSLVYLENALRQKTRNDVLSGAASPKKDTAISRKTVELKDEAITQFIANKSIDADVAYSTVSLAVFQNALVRREMMANYVLADYDLPFMERVGNALLKGWEAFLSFLLALLHLWVFILLAVFAWFSYRHYQKRAKAVPAPVTPS